MAGAIATPLPPPSRPQRILRPSGAHIAPVSSLAAGRQRSPSMICLAVGEQHRRQSELPFYGRSNCTKLSVKQQQQQQQAQKQLQLRVAVTRLEQVRFRSGPIGCDVTNSLLPRQTSCLSLGKSLEKQIGNRHHQQNLQPTKLTTTFNNRSVSTLSRGPNSSRQVGWPTHNRAAPVGASVAASTTNCRLRQAAIFARRNQLGGCDEHRNQPRCHVITGPSVGLARLNSSAELLLASAANRRGPPAIGRLQASLLASRRVASSPAPKLGARICLLNSSSLALAATTSAATKRARPSASTSSSSSLSFSNCSSLSSSSSSASSTTRELLTCSTVNLSSSQPASDDHSIAWNRRVNTENSQKNSKLITGRPGKITMTTTKTKIITTSTSKIGSRITTPGSANNAASQRPAPPRPAIARLRRNSTNSSKRAAAAVQQIRGQPQHAPNDRWQNAASQQQQEQHLQHSPLRTAATQSKATHQRPVSSGRFYHGDNNNDDNNLNDTTLIVTPKLAIVNPIVNNATTKAPATIQSITKSRLAPEEPTALPAATQRNRRQVEDIAGSPPRIQPTKRRHLAVPSPTNSKQASSSSSPSREGTLPVESQQISVNYFAPNNNSFGYCKSISKTGSHDEATYSANNSEQNRHHQANSDTMVSKTISIKQFRRHSHGNYQQHVTNQAISNINGDVGNNDNNKFASEHFGTSQSKLSAGNGATTKVYRDSPNMTKQNNDAGIQSETVGPRNADYKGTSSHRIEASKVRVRPKVVRDGRRFSNGLSGAGSAKIPITLAENQPPRKTTKDTKVCRDKVLPMEAPIGVVNQQCKYERYESNGGPCDGMRGSLFNNAQVHQLERSTTAPLRPKNNYEASPTAAGTASLSATVNDESLKEITIDNGLAESAEQDETRRIVYSSSDTEPYGDCKSMQSKARLVTGKANDFNLGDVSEREISSPQVLTRSDSTDDHMILGSPIVTPPLSDIELDIEPEDQVATDDLDSTDADLKKSKSHHDNFAIEKTSKNLALPVNSEKANSAAPDIPIKMDQISDYYDLDSRAFARGKFAQVKRCTNKVTKQCFAAKCIKKRRRLVDIRHEILLEIEALKLSYCTDHIVKLYEVFETSSEMILILELAKGGELQRVIDDEEFIEEANAKIMVRQILEGLSLLHDNEIAHLDIKPQNLLLTEAYPSGAIKLCDFGISRRITKDSEIREICGTPDYVAPEILRYDPISLATDMWSLGVLTYVLLSGCSPFGGDNRQQTFCNITQGPLEFPEEIFGRVSKEGIDFIQRLIDRNPSRRLTSRQASEHPWIAMQ